MQLDFVLYGNKHLHIEAKPNITLHSMFLLSVLLIAFVTYFVWKPLLTIATASSFQGNHPSQEAFERMKQQFQEQQRYQQRPKDGYQGGEYIDFEEL